MLFKYEPFISHAGLPLEWKIECDALTDDDLQSIANVVMKRFVYRAVVGVPRGGLRLAELLQPHCSENFNNVLIVDDVLTTGKSMLELRKRYDIVPTSGFVIFARGKCPSWITPFFQLDKAFW